MRYVDVPPRNIRKRRLLILVPVVLLFIFLYIVGYRATALRREVNKFGDSTNAIAGQSNFLGKQFRAALKTKSKSKFLNESLNNIVDQALGLSQRAEAIQPPQNLKLAHSFFSVSMKLRHQGLEKYSRAVIASLSTIEPTNKDASIKGALEDISLSDVAYSYFLQETRRYLSSNNLKISLKKSAFLSASTIKSVTVVKEEKPAEKKAQLKEKEKDKESADVYIEDVATSPLRIGYNSENDVRVLPDTDEVDVRIEVGNKGKADEEDVGVEVYLYNKGKFVAKKSAVLDSVEAGGTNKISIKNFKVKSEGLNTFKIKAGPLVSEKNIDDNNYTYKFVLESQDSNSESQ